MNKNTKKRLILCAVLLLTGAWVWRYVTLNAYWKSTIPAEYEELTYQLGDVVTCEEDIIMPAGYAIRGNGIRFVDYRAYLDDNDISIERESKLPPDKLALVDITLYNVGEEDVQINLLDFYLHGINLYLSFDWEVLAASNPVLGGATGVILRAGEAHDFVLVYDVREEYLNRYLWKHLETSKVPLYLKTSFYPKRQEIQLQ